ncbi:MAG: flagellar basal body L-ring protein FlgH [Acidobacteria bacterium]|nr:MAG: flagellar basal body L-ring protein FlgH [Acidobacteriota bacterium]
MNRMLRVVFPSLALVALLAGCASGRRAGPTMQPPELPDLEPAIPAAPVSEGSLYRDGGAADLVGDFRARHVGDVLTIRITESALGSSSADNKLDRKSDSSYKAPVILGWENKVAGKLGPDFDPTLALDTASESSFEGTGETTRKASLTATVAARVLAVGSHGQLLIAGTKKISVNREHQYITLVGIVRAEDVLADNSIPSSRIAELTIHFGGTGDVADATRQPWFQRVMSKIWPF